MTESHMDKNIKLTTDEWAVTLIRIKRHAEIVVEGVDENENYLCKIIHLIGYGSAQKLYSGVGCASGVSPSYTSTAGIKIQDFTQKRIECDAKSPTWNLLKAAADNLLNSTETEKKNLTVQFSLFGRHAWFNVIKQMMGFPSADSCCSWALNKLLQAGIKFKIDGNGFNLVCYTDNYVAQDVQLETCTIKDLCKFAKEGDINAIRLNFSNQFDVNQLTKDACVGPVESFLGLYNPLALAVAYNQYEVVKILIEEYAADPNQCVGRKFDHTALDCAKRKFWFVEKTSEAIGEYLISLPKKEDKLALKPTNLKMY